jgi:hypothetical protein
LPSQSALTVTDRGEAAVTKRRNIARKGSGFGRDKVARKANEQTRVSDDRKVQPIENRLADYKAAIQEALHDSDVESGVFIIDDFYLISREVQPDVIDYVHRLLRDTDLFFKVGTVQHRTTLVRDTGLHQGVQSFADVDGLNLDRTLEDLDQTSAYLEAMLRELAKSKGIDDVLTIMSEEARKDLTLLAGGVPRDYLNIFVGGLALARAAPNRRRITPTDLRKAAVALSNETKLRDLRADAGGVDPALEGVFVDLVRFCLSEKRKTAFLVPHDQIQADPDTHELIQQLMDFKLIHLVEPSTSAASGRPGRFAAYTLDFSLFMEPRRRNIEIVKFWETDDQRRRVKLREAPVYDLSRAAAIKEGSGGARAEDALKIADEVEPDPHPEPVQLFLAVADTDAPK